MAVSLSRNTPKKGDSQIVLRPSDSVELDLTRLRVALEEIKTVCLSSTTLSHYHSLTALSYSLSAASSWVQRALDLSNKDPHELERSTGGPDSILYRFAESDGDERIYETRVLVDAVGNILASEPHRFPLEPTPILYAYAKIGRVKNEKRVRRKSK